MEDELVTPDALHETSMPSSTSSTESAHFGETSGLQGPHQDAPTDAIAEADEQDEIAALVMAYILRHRESDRATADLLNLLSIIAPGKAPESKYLLLKAVGAHQAEATKHLFCFHCKGYLGPSNEVAHNGNCENCGCSIDTDSCPFFLVMPLKEQLLRILAQPDLKQVPTSRGGPLITDILDGKEHKSICSDFTKNDISLMWNTDGIRVFEKSTFDIWPIQCEILQLEPAERKQNMLMPAIWFGASKPNMTTLLTPFVKELQELSAGFSYVRNGATVTTRVFAVVCSVDAVARSAVKNCKQFNGHYGCGWCYHPGGSTYPYLDPPPEPRTKEKHLMEAEEGTPQQPVKGVKGPSIILTIPRFNPVTGFIPDYQHCVCLGVMRQLMKLWLDSENHSHPWYIGTQIPAMNKILLSMQPPSEITRTPRRLEDRAYWKATEYRALLLFYGYVVLKPVLPPQYFQHFILLASAVYLLLKEQISERDVCEARALLCKFALRMGVLYGNEHMSYNIHQLLHLADAVAAWGPLWANSCFPFEGRNATLLKYFSGTQGVAEQIARTFLMWQQLFLNRSKMSTPEAVQLFDDMTARKNMGKTGLKITDDLVVYTRQSSAAVNVRFEVALERYLGTAPSKVVYYHRFQCNSIVWNTEDYYMPKRANCVAQLKDGSFGVLHALAVFAKPGTGSEIQHLVLIEKLNLLKNIPFKDNQLGIAFSHVREGTRSGIVVACNSKNLTAKCTIMERSANSFLAIPLPNKTERD
ncbi:uncharacterized protein ISCGN_025977 [Ixodes scapularis]